MHQTETLVAHSSSGTRLVADAFVQRMVPEPTIRATIVLSELEHENWSLSRPLTVFVAGKLGIGVIEVFDSEGFAFGEGSTLLTALRDFEEYLVEFATAYELDADRLGPEIQAQFPGLMGLVVPRVYNRDTA